MRRVPALIAAAVLLVPLTSCASTGGSADCVPSGAASDVVEATGELGSQPGVSFPFPLKTRTAQKSVLIDGDTMPLRDGQPVILEATILSGDDGSVLQQTAYSTEGGSLVTIGNTQLAALGEALACSELGSRVAIVAENDAAEAQGPGAPESLVYVVDVLDAFPSKAYGAPQTAEPGMPSVVTAPDGSPGVTIPNESAPSNFRQSLLKKGAGAEITGDDAVIVKFTAVDWEQGEVALSPASTWETGNATVVSLERDRAVLGSGFVEAVVGETIGSQVLAVVPPGLAGSDGQSPPTTATLVYVIDILGTVGD